MIIFLGSVVTLAIMAVTVGLMSYFTEVSRKFFPVCLVFLVGGLLAATVLFGSFYLTFEV